MSVSHLTCPLPPHQSVIWLAIYHSIKASPHYHISQSFDLSPVTTLLSHLTCPLPPHQSVIWYALYHHIPFQCFTSVNTRKTRDQNLRGVKNLKFFHMTHIYYEMAAIFLFFLNGWYWYSFSINTQKTRDANFGVLIIWIFLVWCIFMKWQPFVDFFDNGCHWYSISIDTQTTREANFKMFPCDTYLWNGSQFFNFFIKANAYIPFLLTFEKPETQTLGS